MTETRNVLAVLQTVYVDNKLQTTPILVRCQAQSQAEVPRLFACIEHCSWMFRVQSSGARCDCEIASRF